MVAFFATFVGKILKTPRRNVSAAACGSGFIVRYTSLTAGSIFDLLPGIQAVQNRHSDVDDDHVWLQICRASEQRAAVAHCADHIKFRVEQLLAQIRHQSMIVGY